MQSQIDGVHTSCSVPNYSLDYTHPNANLARDLQNANTFRATLPNHLLDL